MALKKSDMPKPKPMPLPKDYVFGRPTKYKDEYCEMLIKHMSEGYSFASFGAIIMTTEPTLIEWTKVHDDFFKAKEQGRALERLYWEKLHNKCAANGEGNATAIIWGQKNKFPDAYRERNEPAQINVNTQLNNVTVNQWESNADARMKQLLAKEQGLLALNEKEIIEVL
jgi:hypothetical protein